MIPIRTLSHRRVGIKRNHSDFSGRKLNMRIFIFFGKNLSDPSGGAHQFASEARIKFNIMNRRSFRDRLKGQVIADFNLRTFAAHYRLPHPQSVGAEDITFLAVFIFQEGNAGASIRIILDREDLRWNPESVAPKIHEAQTALVAPAAAARRDVAVRVAAA